MLGKKSKKKLKSKDLKKIIIVGNPNVGKSVLFNNLTKRYVAVSNYPGTTVEVSRGRAKIDNKEFELIDTPGMYSFLPITEEERVARHILINEKPDIVLHIIDAKNLERMLTLTLQLIESALPVILVLNIMDEAKQAGVDIDIERLENELNIPVVGTVSTSGKGIDILKKKILHYIGKSKSDYKRLIKHPVENTLVKIENLLNNEYNISKRSISIMLLQEDQEIKDLVEKKQPGIISQIEKIVKQAKTYFIHPIEYEIALYRNKEVNLIIDKVVKIRKERIDFKEKLSRIMMNPITGIPILFLVLYFGLFKFVGEFGAGVVVNFIEGTIFEENINPFLIKLFSSFIPWKIIQNLFIGEYGVLTLGIRYAVALILPIVTFFFIFFSIMEDSGYLPRLSMLIDRIFKKIGLSGRAVIPMVLGFGCDTMATMVTRTLPTLRERIISTMLLALAVPCSAQLGVIIALLEGNPFGMIIWAGTLVIIFLFIGYLTAKILPGEKPSFYMEVPPLRIPKISNILIKTYVRVKWYFKEVLPLFLFASILIWFGQLTGIFDIIINILHKPVKLIGLPDEAAKIFLFGFFRRDYGVAGLYDLSKSGILNGVQLVVASIALTLFLPCIAQFLMNVKERGWKIGLGISIFILFFSFGVAFVVNLILIKLGVIL